MAINDVDMKNFWCLYGWSRRCYFLEKWKFLDCPLVRKWYPVYLLVHSSVVILLLYGLGLWLPQYAPVLSVVPLLVSVGKIISVDNKKWTHYYREDWLMAYPCDRSRFRALLWGNLVVDWVIQDNILASWCLSSLYWDFSIMATLHMSVVMVYVIVLSSQLIFMQAKLWLKKLYAGIVYLVTSLLTVWVVYWLVKIVISLIKMIAHRQQFDLPLVRYGSALGKMIVDHHVWFWGGLVVITVVHWWMIELVMRRGYFGCGTQKMSARPHDLWIVSKYLSWIDYRNHADSWLWKKELAVILELYHFHYREYFYTFGFDRSIFMVLGILVNLWSYDVRCLEWVLVPVITTSFI